MSSAAKQPVGEKRPLSTAAQNDISLYLELGAENERENILLKLREEYEALKDVGEHPTYLQGLEHAILLLENDLADPEKPDEKQP
jgi:hypothetical protein